jgi:hypothetical protein
MEASAANAPPDPSAGAFYEDGDDRLSFIEAAAAEEPFVSCILFYVGGVSLLDGIGMMFVPHQFVV